MQTLTKQLLDYSQSDYYPFHMPGHKRNHTLPVHDMLSMDITEIDDFDNLHHAKEILKTGMERAATLYHADHSYFLVNGSTCGILSAISAVTKQGDTILMARNSHKSAYHAAILKELHLHYLYPEPIPETEINGGISPEETERFLSLYPEIKAVFITSPTYEGIVSDVDTIAKIAHSYNIPLIVDEAHGAHFGFSKGFPASAVTQGADLVIQSLHKTLPALTQTALLHLNGKRVNQKCLESYLRIYQTSSPSYLLLSSIDSCLSLLETNSIPLFHEYEKRLNHIREELSKLHYIFIPTIKKNNKTCVFSVDNSKLLLSCHHPSMDGKKLYQTLRECYHLQCEMCMGSYVLAMTSIMDTEEGFNRLIQALKEIDESLAKIPIKNQTKPIFTSPQIHLLTECSIAESQNHHSTWISLSKSEGTICSAFIYLYPPGIPLIVPGERISKKILDCITQYQNHGFELVGIKENKIKILQLQKGNIT